MEEKQSTTVGFDSLINKNFEDEDFDEDDLYECKPMIKEEIENGYSSTGIDCLESGHLHPPFEEFDEKSYEKYRDVLIESISKDEAMFEDEEDVLSCEHCEYTSSDADLLNLHMKNVHLLNITRRGFGRKSHCCTECHYKTHKKCEFERHMKRKHLKLKYLKCPRKGCKFKTCYKTEMSKHIKIVHLDATPYECSKCDFTSAYKSSLRTHINDIHLKNNCFECTICKITFLRKDKFERHTSRVHNFNCRDCDFQGINREDLLDHVKIHFFHCPECDFIAERRSDVRAHFNTVHSREKPHACDLCNFRTNYKYYLRTHIESFHLKNNPYECTHCDYKAHHPSVLRKHLDHVHFKMKNYECPQCNFKSSLRSGLKKHIESVHEHIRPYKCTECDFASSYRHHISRHQKKIHLNDSGGVLEESSKEGEFSEDVIYTHFLEQ